MSNIEVDLYNSSNDRIGMTVTDNNGYWEFDYPSEAGTYIVRFKGEYKSEDYNFSFIVSDSAPATTLLYSEGQLSLFGSGEVVQMDYVDNLIGQPDELADINAGEGSKLSGIEIGADVTANYTSNDTSNVNSVAAATVQGAAQAPDNIFSTPVSDSNTSSGGTPVVIYDRYFEYNTYHILLKWLTIAQINIPGQKGYIKLEVFTLAGVSEGFDIQIVGAGAPGETVENSLDLTLLGLVTGTAYRIKVQVYDDGICTLTMGGGNCHVTKG